MILLDKSKAALTYLLSCSTNLYTFLMYGGTENAKSPHLSAIGEPLSAHLIGHHVEALPADSPTLRIAMELGACELGLCYANATRLTFSALRAQYVLGYISERDSSQKVPHAWNVVGGKHVDVTPQPLLQNSPVYYSARIIGYDEYILHLRAKAAAEPRASAVGQPIELYCARLNENDEIVFEP